MRVHSYSTIKRPLLAAGLFAGPAAFFVDLNVRYFWIEARKTELVAYAVAAICIAVALAGAAACHAVARRPRADDDLDDSPQTRRFIALSGAVLDVFFAFLILAALVPQLFLGVGD